MRDQIKLPSGDIFTAPNRHTRCLKLFKYLIKYYQLFYFFLKCISHQLDNLEPAAWAGLVDQLQTNSSLFDQFYFFYHRFGNLKMILKKISFSVVLALFGLTVIQHVATKSSAKLSLRGLFFLSLPLDFASRILCQIAQHRRDLQGGEGSKRCQWQLVWLNEQYILDCLTCSIVSLITFSPLPHICRLWFICHARLPTSITCIRVSCCQGVYFPCNVVCSINCWCVWVSVFQLCVANHSERCNINQRIDHIYHIATPDNMCNNIWQEICIALNTLLFCLDNSLLSQRVEHGSAGVFVQPRCWSHEEKVRRSETTTNNVELEGRRNCDGRA